MIRLQQAAIMLVATAIAVAMVVLGLWQMQVFRDQGEADIVTRAEAPARPLDELATPGEENRDGYGRQVTFAGTYDPSQQFLIPVPERPGHYRVLTALVRADDTVVPVVRGEITGTSAPAPPTGSTQEQGLFLASEAASDGVLPPGQIGSVRLSQIAQEWTRPMVPGFVTLDAEHASRQGMTQAQVTLPSGQGHLRNGGYALQWWIFAGFGLVMAAKIARDLGRRHDWDAYDESQADAMDPATAQAAEPTDPAAESAHGPAASMSDTATKGDR